MLDIKWIEKNEKEFDRHMEARNCNIRATDVITLRKEYLNLSQKKQDLKTEQNKLSKEIAKATDKTALLIRANELKEQLSNFKSTDDLSWKLHDLMLGIPNILDESVTVGKDETENTILYEWGKKPTFNAKPREHFELTDLMDFETASKISGSRFVILRKELAMLERALGQFMLNTHISEHGYEEISVPAIVNDQSLYGTGQLPKFEDDLYQLSENKYLSPTSEVQLANVKRNLLDNKAEISRFTALTPCFRSEAGAAGKDTKGMLRQHQFNKVELVSIIPEEQAKEELKDTLFAAESILRKLGLHYRVVRLCSGDIGFSSKLTYDIEVWLPGQNAYREISSVSWCGDFQARRMNMMHRDENGNTKHYHTINGSGVAVGRALIAVLENYQTNNSITIPEILKPYINFVSLDIK